MIGAGHLNPVQAKPPSLGWYGYDLEGQLCDGPPSNFGPYDYTNSVDRAKHLPIVEEYHFNRSIRLLQDKKRMTGGLAGNIGYTLRAFPNHYIALASLMNVELIKHEKPSPPVICYFQRAEAFKPRDYRIKMLKGIYLRRKGLYNQSLKAFKAAEELNRDSAQLMYNIGLLYLDMKKYKKAAEYAKKAYAKGYRLQRLRKELKKKGIDI